MNLSSNDTDQVWLLLRLTSFCMSYCPLLKLCFPDFLCHPSRHWLEISYMNLSWRNTGHVQLLSFVAFGLPWIESVPFAKNEVSWTFLSRLLLYRLEIWYMNLSWYDTDQVWLLVRLTYFCMSYCPLLKFIFRTFVSFHLFSSILAGVMPLSYLLGPVGDMYYFSNTYRMLVYILILNIYLSVTLRYNQQTFIRSNASSYCQRYRYQWRSSVPKSGGTNFFPKKWKAKKKTNKQKKKTNKQIEKRRLQRSHRSQWHKSVR